MKTAVDALTNLSLDPEAQRIAWERDRNERGWRHMMGGLRQTPFPPTQRLRGSRLRITQTP